MASIIKNLNWGTLSTLLGQGQALVKSGVSRLASVGFGSSAAVSVQSHPPTITSSSPRSSSSSSTVQALASDSTTVTFHITFSKGSIAKVREELPAFVRQFETSTNPVIRFLRPWENRAWKRLSMDIAKLVVGLAFLIPAECLIREYPGQRTYSLTEYISNNLVSLAPWVGLLILCRLCGWICGLCLRACTGCVARGQPSGTPSSQYQHGGFHNSPSTPNQNDASSTSVRENAESDTTLSALVSSDLQVSQIDEISINAHRPTSVEQQITSVCDHSDHCHSDFEHRVRVSTDCSGSSESDASCGRNSHPRPDDDVSSRVTGISRSNRIDDIPSNVYHGTALMHLMHELTSPRRCHVEQSYAWEHIAIIDCTFNTECNRFECHERVVSSSAVMNRGMMNRSSVVSHRRSASAGTTPRATMW